MGSSRSALGERPAEAITSALDMAVVAVELIGACVIIGGIIWAAYVFLRDVGASNRAQSAYRRLRSNLGRAILVGLELLVGADILATVTAPLTVVSVGLLGLVVLIRTFLSFSLETEIEGRWPWRRAGASTSNC